jgi:hypothetical protein
MSARPVVSSPWFYRLLAAYTGLHLVWGVALMTDFILHPLAPDPLSLSIGYRWLLALGLAPAGLFIAVLVIRRAPGNVSGLCLLLHCVLVMHATLRADSPLAPYNGTLNTAWSGLWVLGLFFPDGRPQPRRLGRLIEIIAALSLLSNAAWGFFQPTLGSGPNPLFIAPLGPWANVVSAAQSGLLLTVALMIPPSLFIRYRASGPRQRQQLKWLLWPFVLLILGSLPLWIAALLAGGTDPFASLSRLAVNGVASYIYFFPFVSVGAAILWHRLYDIDVLIRRTLVYSALTALLALAYFGLVVVLQGVLRAVTGESQNELVTVLSTLIIAALFIPLRARVQRAIDRRFYRRKYDAARTLAGFWASARDETNLAHLTERLLGVVDETMQPQQVGLWLREPQAQGTSHTGPAK